MSDAVILLHGLWLRSAAMGYLDRQLRGQGFSTSLFDYSSAREGIEAVAARLRAAVAAHGGRAHLVGHSLGGVLAALAVQRDPALTDGRIVCLGSPLCGSASSRSLQRLPGGAALLGRSAETLDRGLERWDGPQQLGAIAGRLPFGAGLLLGRLSFPHDGTVAVAETRLPGLADHRVIAAAHAGLMFSDVAARHVSAFLREGKFAA